jgi:myxalamid-type polyketide synthase MxaB
LGEIEGGLSALELPQGERWSEGQWLIFADTDGLGNQVAEALSAQGHDCILVSPGKAGDSTADYTVNPTQPTDFHRLFNELNWSKGGILYLWGLSNGVGADISAGTLQDSCGGLLHLTQALAARELTTSTRVWIVTRGCQTTGAEFGQVVVNQAPLWGLGRVMMREQPDLQPTLLDLDPAGGENEAEAFLSILTAGDAEQQIALRDNKRYVARLVSRQARPVSAPELLDVPDYPYELDTTQRGILEDFKLRPQERRPPGPGEVEIQIYATGLNFRDVLNALGQLSGHIGRECSGVIVACGEGVTDIEVGDAVVAVFAYESFSSFVTVDARFVVPKPPHLSFETAATIPIVFLTAYYWWAGVSRATTGSTGRA